MIDKFGKVMIYVHKPRAVADFWEEKIGFTELKVNRQGANILSVTLTPNHASDAVIELFDKKVLEEMAPEVNSGTPSICFSSYDIADMRSQLIEKGVEVGDVVERAGVRTFNFSDIEGNWFAVQEL